MLSHLCQNKLIVGHNYCFSIHEGPIYYLIGINKISDILVFFIMIKTIEGEYVSITISVF